MDNEEVQDTIKQEEPMVLCKGSPDIWSYYILYEQNKQNLYIEDITRVVISYEIYQTSLRRV